MRASAKVSHATRVRRENKRPQTKAGLNIQEGGKGSDNGIYEFLKVDRLVAIS